MRKENVKILHKPDFAAARARYDLEDVVARFAGEGQRNGHVIKWHCPFHSERTPSFVVDVNAQTWHCYGACNEGGDVFGFIQKQLYGRFTFGASVAWEDPNDPVLGAYEYLTGETCREFVGDATPKAALVNRPAFVERAEPRAPVHRPRKTITIPQEQLSAYTAHRDLTVAFFRDQRGIEEPIIDLRQLGTAVDFGSHFYKWSNGQKENFKCRRYVVPYQYGKRVFKLNMRRDDQHCLELIAGMDWAFLDRLRDDLAEKDRRRVERDLHRANDHPGFTPSRTEPREPRQFSDEDIMEELFGPKYWQVGTGSIFGLNRLFKADRDGNILRDRKGNPVPEELHYVTIHESEITAIAVEQFGYPAVRAKINSNVDFGVAFRGVRYPVIFADNDENGAGAEQARKLRDAIGSPMTKIVHVPAPYSDANDMLLTSEGQRLFADLMTFRHFSPILTANKTIA